MKYTSQQLDTRLNLTVQLPQAGPQPPEARRAAMQQAVIEILKQNHWEPRREPRLKPLGNSGNELRFVCELELFPEVSLPPSLQLAIAAPELPPVTGAELQAGVEGLQLQLSQQTNVQRPCQWGDLILVDLVGVCQGQLLPFSARSQLPVFLHKNQSELPFLQAFVGLKPGESVHFEEKLAADYPYLLWRNKAVSYHAYVHAVREVQIPDAETGLAPLSGLAPDFESLLQHLHAEITQRKRRQWLEDLQDQLVAQAVAAASVQLPAQWVKETLQADWQATDAAALQQSVLPIAAELLESGLKTWQQQMHLRQQYEQRLKTQLVMREIARQAGLNLPDAEIEKALEQIGKSLGISRTEAWQALQAERQEDFFLSVLMLKKTARWLLKQAQITYQQTLLTL